MNNKIRLNFVTSTINQYNTIIAELHCTDFNFHVTLTTEKILLHLTT